VSGHRLDPDRAAAEAAGRPRPAPEQVTDTRPAPQQVIDTRPYRRMSGGIGIGIAVVISALLFITHGGVGQVGVSPGHKLHWFVAPLSSVAPGRRDDANLHPRCDPAHPNTRALNVCPWLAARKPIVLAFFVAGDSDCTREIDTMQAVSRRFSPGAVEFAAVAVRASRSSAARLVRTRRWTIPVAYDPDGAVGEIYGVEVCPLLELAHQGGVVSHRLVGDEWHSSARLAAKVRALIDR
jgi:peroxiredoxin